MNRLLVKIRPAKTVRIDGDVRLRALVAARLGIICAAGWLLARQTAELPHVTLGADGREHTNALERSEVVAAAAVAVRDKAHDGTAADFDDAASIDTAAALRTLDDGGTGVAQNTRIVTHRPQDGQVVATDR